MLFYIILYYIFVFYFFYVLYYILLYFNTELRSIGAQRIPVDNNHNPDESLARY